MLIKKNKKNCTFVVSAVAVDNKTYHFFFYIYKKAYKQKQTKIYYIFKILNESWIIIDLTFIYIVVNVNLFQQQNTNNLLNLKQRISKTFFFFCV